jgi:branched-chain amino acid transport system substrate-binding protein
VRRFALEGPRTLVAVASTALLLSVGISACGSSNNNSSSGGGGSASTTAASTANSSKCGLGNGKKATGAPIKLGAIVTKQPGVDFTDISAMAGAYFDCVNDNGGINGRPISYDVQTEQTNPQQISSLATKLLESDKVLGLVGSTSLLDCAVNHKFYEAHNFYPIVAGVPRECFFTKNIAAVNMGPYYSGLGAAQYLVRQGAKSLVSIANKAPGADFDNVGVADLAKQKGLPHKEFLENVPITDGAGVALKLAQAAGDGGGVVVDFIPPEALKVFQGAQQQGLIDKVHWACATPCNDASLLKGLDPAWDGKIGVNAELNLISSTGPDQTLYKTVQAKYAPKSAIGSFGQMGFTAANIATHALLGIKGDYTAKTVNDAFHNVKDFKTDILCNPWTFGKGAEHVPNDADRTIVPNKGAWEQKENCFDIAALPSNPLAQLRALNAK